MNTVLLLAYRRWQNINPILDVCRRAGVNRIFIHIDGGKTLDERNDVARTVEAVTNYKQRWEIDIRIATQLSNIGCAVSMILSLNAVFSTETQMIILEDDCIPTLDFFYFIKASREIMNEGEKIGLACGAQFAPSKITEDIWLLGRYPFNWGWTITKTQWATLSANILNKDKLKSRENLSFREVTYWNAGSRRALQGFTDVWDTLLVREMLRNDLYAILPGVNLVSNVGNDAHALHTQGAQTWTNFPTGHFYGHKAGPNYNHHFDSWARSKFFRISHRHLVSTRITWCLDLLFTKRKRRPLQERIQFASVSFKA